MKNREEKRAFYVSNGMNAYRTADKSHWRFAFFAAHIVGQYDYGATIGMANDMSVDTSTVENHAHAWQMFYDLVCLGPEASRFVRTARTLPYIYYSHFKALYEVRNNYKLTNEQCLDLLNTIVQAEGEFSARSIEGQVRKRFGDSRDWTFYAQKVQKEISELLKQPDLPTEGKQKIIDTYNWIGDNS